ncbi:MAG: acyl-CoA thioesterase [Cystobacterineae bacterium]|nr:acyl-CoA thioesterase [Cystobacterineae bacterium]
MPVAETAEPQLSAEIEFSVEFYEVDMMEIVWHGNYAKYLEQVRCALLDDIGYGYLAMRDSGFVFPVTNLSLKFIRPLRFGDKARAKAVLEEYENRLRISYELFNAQGELAAKGVTTQMAFELSKNESRFVCPPLLIQKVEARKAKLFKTPREETGHNTTGHNTTGQNITGQNITGERAEHDKTPP